VIACATSSFPVPDSPLHEHRGHGDCAIRAICRLSSSTAGVLPTIAWSAPRPALAPGAASPLLIAAWASTSSRSEKANGFGR
jgi:hypothetical protein